MTDKKLKKKYTIELPEETIEALEKYALDDGVKPENVIQDMLDWYYFPEKDRTAYLDLIFDNVIIEISKEESVTGAFIQRKFSVGYKSAQALLSRLASLGYVEDTDEIRPRKVLKKYKEVNDK